MGLEFQLFNKVIIKRDTSMIPPLNDCSSYSPQLWFLTVRAKEMPVEGEKAAAHCPWKGIPTGDCKNKVQIVGIQASFLQPFRRVQVPEAKGSDFWELTFISAALQRIPLPSRRSLLHFTSPVQRFLSPP